MEMPLYPTWQDICVRLLLTLIAGAIIGFNRGAKGHAAGLRTTILVALAAAVSMVQANILLSVGGKAADSFGVMDLMRLPLGILTGVGFIGAGAILRRGDLVTGVTTAATLWMVTVIGLCLGGGQLWLGVGATALAVLTLWALKWLDVRIPREHRGTLVIHAGIEAVDHLAAIIAPLGYTAEFRRQRGADCAEKGKIWLEINWSRPEVGPPPLDLVKAVSEHYPVVSFDLIEASH